MALVIFYITTCIFRVGFVVSKIITPTNIQTINVYNSIGKINDTNPYDDRFIKLIEIIQWN